MTFPNGSRAVFAPDGFGRPTRVLYTHIGAQTGLVLVMLTLLIIIPIRSLHLISVHMVDYLNGQLLTQSLNARQFISQISVQKGSNAAVGLNYSYDADARITAITDSVNPSQNRAFTPMLFIAMR